MHERIMVTHHDHLALMRAVQDRLSVAKCVTLRVVVRWWHLN